MEILRSGNRVQVVTNDHILEFNDLDTKAHTWILEDLVNMLTAFEAFTEPKYEDYDYHDYYYNDYDNGILHSYMMTRWCTNIERKLIWGEDYDY